MQVATDVRADRRSRNLLPLDRTLGFLFSICWRYPRPFWRRVGPTLDL